MIILCYHCKLSIDSALQGGVIIYLGSVFKESDVVSYLQDLKRVLKSDIFNADSDFILISKSKLGDDYEHSTKYTLIDLEYDASDVINELLSLSVENYSLSLVDRDNADPLWLHVFGKYINDRLVYIKFKIRHSPKVVVICVSFHYAKDELKFPYKRKE